MGFFYCFFFKIYFCFFRFFKNCVICKNPPPYLRIWRLPFSLWYDDGDSAHQRAANYFNGQLVTGRSLS